MKNEEYEIKIGDAIFSFGEPSPPIESIFFPNISEKDKNLPKENQKERENKNDSSQSS